MRTTTVRIVAAALTVLVSASVPAFAGGANWISPVFPNTPRANSIGDNTPLFSDARNHDSKVVNNTPSQSSSVKSGTTVGM